MRTENDMIEKSDFRIRKLRNNYKIWQAVGSGWEPLADTYQTRAEAQETIDRWVAADETTDDIDAPPESSMQELIDRLHGASEYYSDGDSPLSAGKAEGFETAALWLELHHTRSEIVLNMLRETAEYYSADSSAKLSVGKSEAFETAARWLGEATGADLEAMWAETL